MEERLIIRIERGYEPIDESLLNELAKHNIRISRHSRLFSYIESLKEKKLLIAALDRFVDPYHAILIFTGVHPGGHKRTFELAYSLLQEDEKRAYEKIIEGTLKFLSRIINESPVRVIFAGEFENIGEFKNTLRESILALL